MKKALLDLINNAGNNEEQIVRGLIEKGLIQEHWIGQNRILLDPNDPLGDRKLYVEMANRLHGLALLAEESKHQNEASELKDQEQKLYELIPGLKNETERNRNSRKR